MCLNPGIGINPSFLRFFSRFDGLVINGESFESSSPAECISISKFKYLRSLLEDLDRDSFERARFADDFLSHNYGILPSGLHIPLGVIYVCGKCAVCSRNRRKEYERRLLFEAADYPTMAFFTLTYNNKSLPHDGLCRAHMVKFNKLFRKRLSILYPDVSVRVTYVGEYGVDERYTRRAHYHGIFFFSRPLSGVEWYNITRVFKDIHPDFMYDSRYKKKGKKVRTMLWPHGYIRDFDIVRNSAASASYISKYISKQDLTHVPEGKNPVFIQGPCRGGGLGCSKLDSHIDNILNSDSLSTYVLIGNKVERVGVPRTIRNKIFPSISSVCPKYSISLRSLRLLIDYLYENDPLFPFNFQHPFVKVYDTYKHALTGSRIGIRCREHLAALERFLKFSDKCNVGFAYSYASVICEYLNSCCVDFDTALRMSLKKYSFLSKTPTLTTETRLRRHLYDYEKNLHYIQINMCNEHTSIKHGTRLS